MGAQSELGFVSIPFLERLKNMDVLKISLFIGLRSAQEDIPARSI
jgi:hypothetical protein